MTTMDRPQIDYSSAPPAYQRRWFRRSVALVAAAFLLGGFWFTGPAAWRRTRLLYWQHRAMQYTAPADQVVYEDDPTGASKLAGGSSDDVQLGCPGKPWVRWARAWREFSSAWSPPGTLPQGVAFLHERQTASGARRLVAVVVYPPGPAYASNARTFPRIEARVFRPIAPLASSFASFSSTEIGLSAPLGPRQPVRVYAGQEDLTDPTHFTIRYELNGAQNRLEGWLVDDDSVRLVLHP